MGLVSATVFDFAAARETSDSVMTAFPMGRWGLPASIQHQVFGHWKGYAILDDGSRIEVRDLLDFCGKVVNRW